MAKTNFTKVEEMLTQGLQKIAAYHLLDEADAAASRVPDLNKTDKRQLVSSVQRDLRLLYKKDHETYTKLGITKGFVKKLNEQAANLTSEEFENLKQIQEKIKTFKEELKTKLPPISNETMIESERTKHINKRYNINEKWLPLH